MAISRERPVARTGDFVRAFTLFDSGRHAEGTTVLAWVDSHARLMLREPVCRRFGAELYELPAATITSVEVFDHDEGQAVRIGARGAGIDGFILIGQPAALRSIVEDLRAATADLAEDAEHPPRHGGLLRALHLNFF
jgi:hypothetical protein